MAELHATGCRENDSGEGPIAFLVPSYQEERSTVNNLSCDGLRQVGPTGLLKVAAFGSEGSSIERVYSSVVLEVRLDVK